ncbi:hypothetical protein QCA50_002582 [Cerrena zonata]|uniref:DUF6535 domain-containing protein n=1 Tax=Cerrena zonata TaxID=2478898 RepID=A0AAW0GM93_9APHY
MSSSSNRRRRRSRASNRSNASDSDSNPVRVSSSSDSATPGDQVHDVELVVDDQGDSQSNSDHLISPQQVEDLSPISPPLPDTTARPRDCDAEGIEENAASVEATPIEDRPQHQRVAQPPPDNKKTPPNAEDKVHRVKIEPDRTGWARLSDLIRQYDRDRVEDVKEDIDTILVFAGLFSAVITAFIIESYRTLQQQPEDTTNQILLRLSTQLDSFSVSGNFVNSTIPSFTPSPFIPARFAVLINTLWLLSLVVALITASLGILVKQWLHELMARDTQDPRQQVKLRFFREIGVQRWQVFEIAAALPLLLQLALLLFFIGLSAFLHDLNPVVTWVVTGVMIVWLAFFLFTTFSPAFSSQCPYKTPMLKGLLGQVRIGSHTWLESFARSVHEQLPTRWLTVKKWAKDWKDLLHKSSTDWVRLEETKVCEDDTFDLPTLICSREILRGEQLEETVTACFSSCDIWALYRCMRLLANGQGLDIQRVLPDVPRGYTNQAFQLYRSRMSTLVSPSDSIRELSTWYIVSAYASSNSSVPYEYKLIPSSSLMRFVQLLQDNPMSAIFSILAIYSIWHHTMENNPVNLSTYTLIPSVPGDTQQYIIARRNANRPKSGYRNQSYLLPLMVAITGTR